MVEVGPPTRRSAGVTWPGALSSRFLPQDQNVRTNPARGAAFRACCFWPRRQGRHAGLHAPARFGSQGTCPGTAATGPALGRPGNQQTGGFHHQAPGTSEKHFVPGWPQRRGCRPGRLLASAGGRGNKIEEAPRTASPLLPRRFLDVSRAHTPGYNGFVGGLGGKNVGDLVAR